MPSLIEHPYSWHVLITARFCSLSLFSLQHAHITSSRSASHTHTHTSQITDRCYAHHRTIRDPKRAHRASRAATTQTSQNGLQHRSFAQPPNTHPEILYDMVYRTFMMCEKPRNYTRLPYDQLMPGRTRLALPAGNQTPPPHAPYLSSTCSCGYNRMVRRAMQWDAT